MEPREKPPPIVLNPENIPKSLERLMKASPLTLKVLAVTLVVIEAADEAQTFVRETVHQRASKVRASLRKYITKTPHE